MACYEVDYGQNGGTVFDFFLNGEEHQLSEFANPITLNCKNNHKMYFGKVPSGYTSVRITASSGNVLLGTLVLQGVNGEVKYIGTGGTSSSSLSLSEDIEFISFAISGTNTDRDLIITFS